MSEEAKDDNKLEFDVMPGADIVEDEETEALDLSFPEPEPEEEKEEEVAEEGEEVVA